MTRRPKPPRHGDGTVWVVVDQVNGDYLCYWYAGLTDNDLVEHARAATADDAVEWGRQRTPRVRIRTADNCTYWAGTVPSPAGLTLTWS